MWKVFTALVESPETTVQKQNAKRFQEAVEESKQPKRRTCHHETEYTLVKNELIATKRRKTDANKL